MYNGEDITIRCSSSVDLSSYSIACHYFVNNVIFTHTIDIIDSFNFKIVIPSSESITIPEGYLNIIFTLADSAKTMISKAVRVLILNPYRTGFEKKFTSPNEEIYFVFIPQTITLNISYE